MICSGCDGAGYLDGGMRSGGPHSDIMLIDWRKCWRCGGEGIYISRTRAGLAMVLDEPTHLWQASTMR